MAKECHEFRGLQNLYRQIDPAEPAPSEAVFARISQTVVQRTKKQGRQSAPSLALAQFLSKVWEQLRASVAVPWMFAAAQAAVIVLLLVPMPQQTTYSTLSVANLASDTENRGINVMFQASATEGEIRTLLHAIGGLVSNGPSQEGRYTITIASKGDLDPIVRALHQSQIVTFAEPVQ